MRAADKRTLDSLKVERDELETAFNAVLDYEELAEKLKKEAAKIIGTVKMPAEHSQEWLALLMLYLFKGRLLHKDDIAYVGSQFKGTGQSDWQIRHAGSQHGWPIALKGDNLPGYNLPCPSGYHMLLDLGGLSPRYKALKRDDLLDENDFSVIKQKYGYACAHCGSKEGSMNRRDGTVTRLQKGHMDPNLPAETNNMIPVCDNCNRTLKDDYLFQKNGAIDRPNYESIRASRAFVRKMLEYRTKEEIIGWLNE